MIAEKRRRPNHIQGLEDKATACAQLGTGRCTGIVFPLTGIESEGVRRLHQSRRGIPKTGEANHYVKKIEAPKLGNY